MKAVMKRIERDAIVLEMDGQEYKLIMGRDMTQYVQVIMNEGFYIEPVHSDKQRELLMISDNPDADIMLNKVISNSSKLPDVYQ
ncbi:hypothetical protein [Kurthia sp. Dielmo]|uniref:hypothetical protein n=1 Tax=Kurthia sp. Dielmo TaxID=1033738 RepID=UPI00111E68A9|nr:hypothetical protein [Kurthia sp. Dielmo]